VPIYNWIFDDLESLLGQCNEEADGREKAAIIDACSPANKRVLKQALEAAHAKLRTYYSKTRADMYVNTVILDPRLQMAYLETNDWGARLMADSKNALLRIMRAYGAEAPQSDGSDDEARLGLIEWKVFGDIKKRRVQADCELERYLLAPTADAGTNVLEWWRLHAKMYPCLARIARDYLAIPATSVPAERVFSGGTDLITKKRGSLSEDTIQACICLGSWF
jgi:hAT family protein